MRGPVLIDARMMGHSGIGTYLRGLLEGFAKWVPDSHEWMILKPSAAAPGAWKGHVRNVDTPIYSFWEQFMLPFHFRSFRPILFHIPHYNVPIACRRHCIATVHDVIHLKFPQFYRSPTAKAYARFYFHRVLPNLPHILTVSEHTRRDLMTVCGLPGERITVTPPGVPTDCRPTTSEAWTARRQAMGLGRGYWLYLGNIKEFKNVPHLVETYRRFRDLHPKSPPLLVIGRNTIPDFETVLRRTPGLLWISSIPRSEVPAVYTEALALLFPSLYEGFGLPPLEAMACGAPVVTSNAASLPEVVGDAAWLVDPADPTALFLAMERLLDDPLLRQSLRERGLARARCFSWETTVRQTLAGYQRAVEG